MNSKTVMKALAPLLKKPYFTSHEARDLGVSTERLSYYIKKGCIERLSRGVYRGMDAPTIDDFRWEDLVNAMATVKNGVICQISALALYDLTDEIPKQHWIAIPNETRHRAAPNIKIVRVRNIELGQTTIKICGIELPIFNRERTIIDAFKYLSKETAIKSLKSAVDNHGNDKINLKKLQRYAKILRFDIKPYLLMVTT